MNTKTLVVGQAVVMGSGCYCQTGKVVRVTPSGVEVQTDEKPWELLHFDSNGRGRDSEGTYECGPWKLDDIIGR